MMKNAIGYFRVSTREQGRSGLGLANRNRWNQVGPCRGDRVYCAAPHSDSGHEIIPLA
jgi:hypothetical protein